MIMVWCCIWGRHKENSGNQWRICIKNVSKPKIDWMVLDLETKAVQTDEVISYLEEENSQLQLTVNHMLQRVQILEATVVSLETYVNGRIFGDSIQLSSLIAVTHKCLRFLTIFLALFSMQKGHHALMLWRNVEINMGGTWKTPNN